MSEHTKEPWYLGKHGSVRGKICVTLQDGGPYVVADTNWNFPDQAKQDARRIVLCVNACAQWTNAELEQGIPLAQIESAMTAIANQAQRITALEQERDRLREVCGVMRKALNTICMETGNEKHCAIATDALMEEVKVRRSKP